GAHGGDGGGLPRLPRTAGRGEGPRWPGAVVAAPLTADLRRDGAGGGARGPRARAPPPGTRGLRPARPAGRGGPPRAGHLLRPLALPLASPGGPDRLVLRFPRHPRPLRLDLLQRRAAGAALPVALRLRGDGDDAAGLTASPDGRGAGPHRAPEPRR